MEKIKDNKMNDLNALGGSHLKHGEIIELEDGMMFCVIPVGHLRKMGAKELKELKKELEAKEILEEAEELTRKRLEQGWTREDFKKDFIKVKKEIAQILSKKQHEKVNRK